MAGRQDDVISSPEYPWVQVSFPGVPEAVPRPAGRDAGEESRGRALLVAGARGLGSRGSSEGALSAWILHSRPRRDTNRSSAAAAHVVKAEPRSSCNAGRGEGP